MKKQDAIKLLKSTYLWLDKVKHRYYKKDFDKSEVEVFEDVMDLKKILWVAYQELESLGLDPTEMMLCIIKEHCRECGT